VLTNESIITRLTEVGKFTPEVYAELQMVMRADCGPFEPLTDNDIRSTCYHLRMQPEVIFDSIAILSAQSDFDAEQAQRVAFANRLASDGLTTRGLMLAMLVDPSILANMAIQGRKDWKKDREYDSDFPGADEWWEEIKDEVAEVGSWQEVPF